MNIVSNNTNLFGANLIDPRLGASPFSNARCYDLAILVVPGFSQVCLSSLIEPLRLANMLARRELFRWRLVGLSSEPVYCSSGIPIGVAASVDSERAAVNAGKICDALVICAADEVEKFGLQSVLSLVRLHARRGTTLFGVNTGAWLLAKAGLPAGARCTIHWHKAAALSEKFEDLRVETALFVRDGALVTCSGGFAAFDMMIDTIEKEFGQELAATVCRYMTADHLRDRTRSLATPASLRLAGTSAKLIGAIRVMEGNLETPVSLNSIAKLMGTSRRQLERLFRGYLSVSPSRHYLNLRLFRARQLLDSTDLRILEIAIACGFESPSHFSKTFREHFGESPNSVRAAASRWQYRAYETADDGRRPQGAVELGGCRADPVC
ncbi:GlxA family transcriptional regulator [Mesorhizobium sp.]|uniref:GlxA family transcriptional regulator n=1 Tax=Mesorhizobium sp. TaxID=1871066 RepID=UPI0025E4008C|nr:GlxA family transcriptional regulator [Mesorhizobium sp.]